jgi:hypothetical protein
MLLGQETGSAPTVHDHMLAAKAQAFQETQRGDSWLVLATPVAISQDNY